MRRTVNSALVALGSSLLYAACGGDATEPPPPEPKATSATVVSGSGQNGTVGLQLPAPLVVEIDDQSSNPMSGVTVAFEVVAGGGSVSSASTSTDATGQASTNWTLGTEAGSGQQVRATVPGTNLMVLFNATAVAGPPVAVSPDSGNNQVAYRGSKLPALLVVRVRDQYANGVPNQLVQFAVVSGSGSVDSAVAFTDATGRARSGWTLGPDVGAQTVEAVVQGVTGSPVSFSATAHNLSITSVSPDPMVLGGTATIVGTGFDAVPGGNVVTVGGEAAVVTGATTSQLDITVPSACLPWGPVEVQVSVAPFTSAPDTNEVRPQSFLQMAVGEQVIVQDPSDFCLQFAEAPGSESYLIGVQSTAEAVTSLTSVMLSSKVPLGQPAPAPPPAALRAPAAGGVPRSLIGSATSRRLRRHRAAERGLRELDRRNFETLRHERPLLQRVGGASEAAIDPNAAVGDTVPLRVITDNTCSEYADITTVVRAKGNRGIFLEDIGNPAGGYTQADFESFSARLDDFIYDTDVGYFGTPLDQDGNGVVAVVVTKQTNLRGSLGFTSSCDYFARTDNTPASNEGEYFYQEAPDPTGTYGEAFTAAEARDIAPTILAHELVHIIQFSERLNAGGGFPSIWIAEGQATFGEEIVGHAVESRSPGQNYGLQIAINFDDTLSIDWYSTVVADMGFYFGWDPISTGNSDGRVPEAPHECSWLALPPENPGPCVGGRDAYGVPWTLLRWLSDQYGATYPGGEQGLQRDVTHNTLDGFALIESLVGTSIDTLLAQWAAMLYVDDFDETGLGNPRLEMSSWNLHDIFYGSFVSGDVVISLIEALRLQPSEALFGRFTRSAMVRGGSTYYSVVSGFDRSAMALKVTDPDGGVLPNEMQLWVVRLK